MGYIMDAVEKLEYARQWDFDMHKTTKKLIDEALEILKSHREWIPVNDRKPKSIANKVIVYLVHDDLVSQIGYGHYEKYQGEELWYNLETGEQFAKRGYTVTHWMAMPESPEGETLVLS